jgi:hypothetical protein
VLFFALWKSLSLVETEPPGEMITRVPFFFPNTFRVSKGQNNLGGRCLLRNLSGPKHGPGLWVRPLGQNTRQNTRRKTRPSQSLIHWPPPISFCPVPCWRISVVVGCVRKLAVISSCVWPRKVLTHNQGSSHGWRAGRIGLRG